MISPAPQTRRSSGRATDLFDADDYHAWIRHAIALRGDPKVVALFDSTIDEPVEALTETLRAAFWPSVTPRYVGVFGSGNRYMLEALVERYGRPSGSFIAASGATSAMGMALRSIAGPGDHVLIETPGFDLIERLSLETGAQVSAVRRRGPDFGIDLEDLRAALRPETKAFVITNLHNPSGAYLPPETLRQIAAELARVGAMLIVDEVYRDFARSESSASSADLADNIVAVSSLTKVFGLFTLKAGWLTAAPDLLEAIRQANPEGDYSVGKLSHAIAALVVERPAPYEAHWTRILHANRPIVAEHAARLLQAGLIEGAVPQYGCIYFPRIIGWEDTRPLARRLWREAGVLVAPGQYFGAPGHIRIGFGAADPARIEQGMSRLAEALFTFGAPEPIA